jgi:hypothetical protein
MKHRWQKQNDGSATRTRHASAVTIQFRFERPLTLPLSPTGVGARETVCRTLVTKQWVVCRVEEGSFSPAPGEKGRMRGEFRRHGFGSGAGFQKSTRTA